MGCQYNKGVAWRYLEDLEALQSEQLEDIPWRFCWDKWTRN